MVKERFNEADLSFYGSYLARLQEADKVLIPSELKRCSDEIISLDLSMQSIYEWINR